MSDHTTIPDFAGILSGVVPIKVEINLSTQSVITIIVAIVMANVLSRLIIK